MRTVERQFDFTNQELQALLAKAEANSLRSLGEFADVIADQIDTGFLPQGIKLPWHKTHDIVRLRKKEVSVWAGINGHRKSTLLNQIALWATKEVVVGIASLEMPVENLAMLMTTQAAGAKHPTKEYAQKAVGKIGRRMWFYDRLGSVPPLEILGACHAMSQQGCELIVVDSLSMCQVSDDMERERVFMSELTSLAKALNVHIALVHHVRKPQSGGDEYIPTRFDVKGSGAIVDLTQNLFLCWANKAKARVERKEALGMTLNDKEREVLEEADQKLIVAKQRFAEFEGHINLWHHPSRQFTATKRRESVDYLGEK
jgi:twinkle protein